MSMSLQIEKVYQKALLLRQRAMEFPSLAKDGLLETALQDLALVLEELQTAEEELQLQNQTLVATRQQLETERQHYQELFHLASDGYVVTDKAGIIQEANHAITNLLNVSPAYLIGKPLSVFIPVEARSVFYTKLDQFTHQYSSRQFQTHSWETQLCPRKIGFVDVTLTVSTSTTYDADGTVLRLLWLIHDITQQKQIHLLLRHLNANLESQVQEHTLELSKAKRQAEAANRAKSTFLSNVGHEFRTPLHAILGMAEILQEEGLGTLNPRQQEAIATIFASGEQLMTLVNNVLTLANSEADKMELQLAPVDVEQLCAASLAWIQPLADNNQIHLQYAIHSDISMILADQQCLSQILRNLLSNAVKFTPAKGQVTLQVSLQGNLQPGEDPMQSTVSPWIVFTVQDTGIGIAPEDLEQIFQPFGQLNSKLNRQYLGSGLGLALVKRLTELHGGTISVHSVVGQGSRFTVRLPHCPISPPNPAP